MFLWEGYRLCQDRRLQEPLSIARSSPGSLRNWNGCCDAGTLSPVTCYQLLLARYSAKFPARRGADGTPAPRDRHILAWVIVITSW